MFTIRTCELSPTLTPCPPTPPVPARLPSTVRSRHLCVRDVREDHHVHVALAVRRLHGGCVSTGSDHLHVGENRHASGEDRPVHQVRAWREEHGSAAVRARGGDRGVDRRSVVGCSVAECAVVLHVVDAEVVGECRQAVPGARSRSKHAALHIGGETHFSGRKRRVRRGPVRRGVPTKLDPRRLEWRRCHCRPAWPRQVPRGRRSRQDPRRLTRRRGSVRGATDGSGFHRSPGGPRWHPGIADRSSASVLRSCSSTIATCLAQERDALR